MSKMFDIGFSALIELFNMYKTGKKVEEMVNGVLSAGDASGAGEYEKNAGQETAGREVRTPFEFPAARKKRKRQTSGEKTERESLFEDLAKGKYVEQGYYAKISEKVAQTAKRNSMAAADSDILDRLNSEELPKSYGSIDGKLAIIRALTAEADFLQHPPQRPDTSKRNYITDAGQIASEYARYFSGRLKLTTRGSKRTLDIVLDEIVSQVGSLQKDVDHAISHSSRIIGGLAAYQEEVIETRIREAAQQWGREFSNGANAQALLERAGKCKQGSSPDEYSQLSTAERNLERTMQHAHASMMNAEACAVQNRATMQTAHSLEGNLRTGLLELERFSTLLAQEVQDTHYTAQGSRLLKHGYRNAKAIGTAAATLRTVVGIRLQEITASINSFRENLNVAQMSVSDQEQQGYIQEPPKAAAGVGYARTREEAIKLFAEMGVKPAKAMYAFGTDAKQRTP